MEINRSTVREIPIETKYNTSLTIHRDLLIFALSVVVGDPNTESANNNAAIPWRPSLILRHNTSILWVFFENVLIPRIVKNKFTAIMAAPTAYTRYFKGVDSI